MEGKEVMTTAVTTQDQRQVARPLNVLVPLIEEDLAQARDASQNAGMPYYKAAGEKMVEARDGNNMSVAEIVAWSKRHFDLGRTQTLLYMSYADTTARLSAATEYDSLKDFRRRELGHDIPTTGGGLRQPSWHQPVKADIERAAKEAARIRNETLTRQQERDAEKKLALQLIDIGFKALASKLHPDKGGSRDAMSRLNRVRARLKQHA